MNYIKEITRENITSPLVVARKFKLTIQKGIELVNLVKQKQAMKARRMKSAKPKIKKPLPFS